MADRRRWASTRLGCSMCVVGAGVVAAQQPTPGAQDSVIVPDSSLDSVVNCRANRVGLSEWARSRGAPTFASLAVPLSDTLVGRPALPLLTTRSLRRFRTLIREGAHRHPNFAGHFSAFLIGCGLGCYTLYIVDARSGRVYESPYLGPPMFRRDSRLLIYDGSMSWRTDSLDRVDDYPVTYYEWNGAQLVLETPSRCRLAARGGPLPLLRVPR